MDNQNLKANLIAALKIGRCPLCHLLERKQYDYLCYFQGQLIQEGKTQDDFNQTGLLCNYHAWYLQDLTSPTANATIYYHLLEGIIDRLKSLNHNGSSFSLEKVNGEDKLGELLLGKRTCPVCREIETIEEFILKELTELFSDEEFMKVYAESMGCCFPHLMRLIRQSSEKEPIEFLITVHVTQLEHLREELKEYISKRESLNRNFGKEGNSWKRVVEKMTGAKGTKVKI
jgi:hypothetical protein